MSYSQQINQWRSTRRRLRANTSTPDLVGSRTSQKAYSNTIRNLLESRVHRAYTMTMDELFLRGYLSRDERLEIAGRIGEFLGLLGEAIDEDGVGQRAVTAEDVTAVAEQKEIDTAVSPPSYFTAFKGSDGRYRWVMISSNSYQDRDGEWATQKAQEADVERMNRTGQFGTLDWWHTKLKAIDGRDIPLDIGDCTHAVMVGRFRLEGGTFRDEVVGASFAATKERMGASLEFLHPTNEPMGGQYHHMFTIRRSVLPADAASNSLTGFVTGQKEQVEMSKATYERLKAMAAQNGVDAVLQAIAGVAELDEQAKGLKLAAKGRGDAAGGGAEADLLASLSDADLDTLAADIVALKEERARTVRTAKEALDSSVTVLGANLELDMDDFATAVTKAFRDVIAEQTDTLTALLTNRTKEQVETDRKATELQVQIKQLNDQLTELKAGPKATKEQQGGVATNGFRPTRHNPANAAPAASQESGQDGFEMIAQKAVNL